MRSAVTHTAGISALEELTDFAGVYQIKSGFHGSTDVSPIGQAAGLHLDVAINKPAPHRRVHARPVARPARELPFLVSARL